MNDSLSKKLCGNSSSDSTGSGLRYDLYLPSILTINLKKKSCKLHSSDRSSMSVLSIEGVLFLLGVRLRKCSLELTLVGNLREERIVVPESKTNLFVSIGSGRPFGVFPKMKSFSEVLF